MGNGYILTSRATRYILLSSLSLFYNLTDLIVPAVTVARVYLDCAEASHYEQLFDNLQKLIKTITGRALAFKRFSIDENVLCMNADMEAAQVLGAARSILKSVDFQFSGLPADISPEELVAYFVHLCLTHTKRLVNMSQYKYFKSVNVIFLQRQSRFQSCCTRSRLPAPYGFSVPYLHRRA